MAGSLDSTQALLDYTIQVTEDFEFAIKKTLLFGQQVLSTVFA